MIGATVRGGAYRMIWVLVFAATDPPFLPQVWGLFRLVHLAIGQASLHPPPPLQDPTKRNLSISLAGRSLSAGDSLPGRSWGSSHPQLPCSMRIHRTIRIEPHAKGLHKLDAVFFCPSVTVQATSFIVLRRHFG